MHFHVGVSYGCHSPGSGESALRGAVHAHQSSQALPGEVRQSGEVLQVQTALWGHSGRARV